MADIIVQGERWFPSPSTFADDLPTLWGDWGCDSEVGRLRAVLMRRPGPEVDRLIDPEPFRWAAAVDPGVARAQHDALADVYRAHGVKVHYVENMRKDRPNAVFVRDLMFMTPEGAIIGRPAMASRRGEERFVTEALGALGVPVLLTVHGEGTFEGACAMWVDRKTVVLGTGVRCNRAGANQVEGILRDIGVERVIRYQIPFGSIHLDGVINIADRDKAMIFPWQVPYDVCRELIDMGFKLIENPHIDEIKGSLGCNFVAIEPGVVVMPAGNPKSKAVLEEAGVVVIDVQIDELMKGLGAVHCMTAFLKRDPI